MEEFDKDVLYELVDSVSTAINDLDKAQRATEHMDEDEHNEEVYEAAIYIEEVKSELSEYVGKFLEAVRNLRTDKSVTALEIYTEGK